MGRKGWIGIAFCALFGAFGLGCENRPVAVPPVVDAGSRAVGSHTAGTHAVGSRSVGESPRAGDEVHPTAAGAVVADDSDLPPGVCGEPSDCALVFSDDACKPSCTPQALTQEEAEDLRARCGATVARPDDDCPEIRWDVDCRLPETCRLVVREPPGEELPTRTAGAAPWSGQIACREHCCDVVGGRVADVDRLPPSMLCDVYDYGNCGGMKCGPEGAGIFYPARFGIDGSPPLGADARWN